MSLEAPLIKYLYEFLMAFTIFCHFATLDMPFYFSERLFFLNAVFVLNLQNMNLAWNLYLYEFLMPITLTFFSRFQRTVALRIIFVTDFFWGSKLFINYSVVWLLSWFKNPGMKPAVWSPSSSPMAHWLGNSNHNEWGVDWYWLATVG